MVPVPGVWVPLLERLNDCVPEGKCVPAESGISEGIQALRFLCRLMLGDCQPPGFIRHFRHSSRPRMMGDKPQKWQINGWKTFFSAGFEILKTRWNP